VRGVDLCLPGLVRFLHPAVGLLEVKLLGAEDLLEEFDERGLACVPITPEPHKALLRVLANEEDAHKGVEHGPVTGLLDFVNTGKAVVQMVLVEVFFNEPI